MNLLLLYNTHKLRSDSLAIKAKAAFISSNLCVFINKTIHNLIIQFDDEL